MTTGRRRTNALLFCGAVAGPLFVAVFSVDGARRKAYDPIREPVSALARDGGWVQRTNFAGTGFLILACATGLRRALPDARWAPRLVGPFGAGVAGAGAFAAAPRRRRLVGLLGAGLVGAGAFVTDLPASTGDPRGPTGPTIHGTLHQAFSAVAFGGLIGACAAMALRFARTRDAAWAAYSALTGVLLVGGVGMFGRAFSNEGLVEVGGMIQRLTVVIGWGWLSALAVRLLRRDRAGRSGWGGAVCGRSPPACCAATSRATRRTGDRRAVGTPARQRQCHPPSTISSTPFTAPFSSRNTAASTTSSLTARRPIGVSEVYFAMAAGFSDQ